MATFNQQNQTVRHQVNGEQVYVGTASPTVAADLDRMIGDLVQRLRHEQRAEAHAVLSYLEQARAASARGDAKGVLATLSKAAEVATPVAAIAGSVASIMQLARAWYD